MKTATGDGISASRLDQKSEDGILQPEVEDNRGGPK